MKEFALLDDCLYRALTITSDDSTFKAFRDYIDENQDKPLMMIYDPKEDIIDKSYRQPQVDNLMEVAKILGSTSKIYHEGMVALIALLFIKGKNKICDLCTWKLLVERIQKTKNA
eukprot:2549049-Ditylum_brightwellii.AAC.1